MARTRTEPEDEHVVSIPSLTGLDVPRAHDTALDGGVLAVEHGPPGEVPERRVTGQQPPAGEVVPRGSTVQMWTAPPPDDEDGGGGGGGVRPVGPGPVLSGQD